MRSLLRQMSLLTKVLLIVYGLGLFFFLPLQIYSLETELISDSMFYLWGEIASLFYLALGVVGIYYYYFRRHPKTF